MSASVTPREHAAHRIFGAWVRGNEVFARRDVFELRRSSGRSPLTDATQHLLLTEIARHGPLALNELARNTGTTASNASKITTALVEAGLVSRRRPARDRRVTLIEATEAGHELDHRMRQVDLALLGERVQELSEGDVVQLADLLERFIEIVGRWDTTVAAQPIAQGV